jgi:hypothetical protein
LSSSRQRKQPVEINMGGKMRRQPIQGVIDQRIV